jgi:hypothetical protein
MNHVQSHKNNYIFIYFETPLEIDDISSFFIFTIIQTNISHKS